MTSQTLVHEERTRRLNRNGLLRLGWPHFWLLSGILGGMLALVAFILLVSF